MDDNGSGLLVLLLVAAALAWRFYRPGWRGPTGSHGTAAFADEAGDLHRAGMLSGAGGLVLGRTLDGGRVIRLRDYCHVLLVGGTGSGKGVSVVVPQLLTYRAGSCVVFDTKGDLARITAARRRRLGHRVLVLGPFTGGPEALNPLDGIENGPMLIDDARALAEALVVRTGMEPDPHWPESAVVVITALLVLVLTRFEGQERSLNSVRELCTDPALFAGAALALKEMGGMPARLGNQLLGYEGKEKAGVLSTANRALAFLDSELVAASLARSTFDPAELCGGPATLYLQIPGDQLEAQRGLLRLWVSALARAVARRGCGRGECLFLLDEASALGSLPALKECLVRGRSGGARLLLAYQSDSQVKAAFEKEPSLLYDNCATQVYLLPPGGLETAERISNMLGEYTQVVEGYQEGGGTSYQEGGMRSAEQGTTYSGNSGRNWTAQARKLMDPSEVLRADRSLLLCFHPPARRPVLARRVLYYRDPLFAGEGAAPPAAIGRLWWAAFLAAALALLGLLAALLGGG